MTWFMLWFSMGAAFAVYIISIIFSDELPGQNIDSEYVIRRESFLCFITFLGCLGIFRAWGSHLGYGINSLLIMVFLLFLIAKFTWCKLFEHSDSLLHFAIASICFVFWLATCIAAMSCLLWMFFLLGEVYKQRAFLN